MSNLCTSLGKMSLQFKKPQKKSLRQRLDDERDPDEAMDVDETSDLSQIKKEKKKKKKEKIDDGKPKPKQTLLSFGEDLHEGEEEEIFQVRKSSQSKKLQRQLDKERRRRREQEKGGSSNGGVVVKQEVKEEPADEGEEPLVVREIKREPPQRVLNGREAEFAQERSDSEDDEEETPRFSRPRQLKHVLESGAIPDAAMIHAARKSRQKAREMGGDYIPVEDPNKNAEGSRLVRDEDHDVSDEEGDGEPRDGQRIDFTVDTAAIEQERRREAFLAAEEEQQGAEGAASDLDDDELENWEAQQIRKAVSGAQLVAAQQEVLQHQAVSAGHLRHRINLSALGPTPRQPLLKVPAVLAAKNEPLAAERVLDLMSRQQQQQREAPPTLAELERLLRERLSTLSETQRRHARDRERAQTELSELALELLDLNQDESERSDRFQFYQDLRGYVTDLVECINHKMPVLEQLESRAVAALGRRTSALVQRRRQDVKDQAAEAAALTRPAGAPLEVDEARVRRAAEREGRRTRRRRGREAAQIASVEAAGAAPPLLRHLEAGAAATLVARHFEGLSSDDEQYELEIASLRSQLEQMERDAVLMLEDVVDEFSQLPLVMRQFEQWKRRDGASYREAYVHLALPKLLAPLVRAELVTWNPLQEGCVGVEGSRWFRCLSLYCLSDTETEQSLGEDPDINLIPLVIELAILPKLTKLVVDAWDPCSTSQSQRLSSLLRQLLTDYPHLASRGRVAKSLLPAVSDRLREAIDNDVFIPIYPARPAAALGLFFQRQFWSAVKLLRNVLLFRGLLAESVLQELAMTALLGRYLLAALRTCEPLDALEKSRHIVYALPRAWQVKEPQPIQLQMFSTQLTNIVKAIDITNPGGRDAMMEALTILRSLGAKTKAEELGQIYL